jgi:hypothetical protein
VVETDIHWVLTVPAIWKDNAKQFMREAAQQVFLLFVILKFYICTILVVVDFCSLVLLFSVLPLYC